MSAEIPAFSIAAAFRMADDIMSKPSENEFSKRPTPRGQVVARFALPLDLCPTTNVTRHAKGWALARIKKQLGALMFVQAGGRCEVPLPGRPQVICRRFSSVQPDSFSDWAKMPVDKLCTGPNRLGYLRDDRPKDCELHQVWEPAPPGKGFVIVEVRAS